MAERKDGNPRTIRNAQATARVLDYLRQNQDIMIPYQEIMRALTLPASTVGNSVGYLITRGNLAIERPMKGTAILHSGKAILSPETIAQLESDRRYAGFEAVTVNEPARSRVIQTDTVSAYPKMEDPEIQKIREMPSPFKIAMNKIAMNEMYGQPDSAAKVYTYVGRAGERVVISDDDGRLFVAEPLESYLS
jgi:hypothetical protein